jgi:nucleotide-binding universal stress UspA family protein
MALKDLLVYLEPAERSYAHLELAFDLARRNASCLTALFVRDWSPEQLAHRRTAELAGRPLAEMAAITQDAQSSLAQSTLEAHATFQRLASRYGLASHWRVVDGDAHSLLTQQARYADLCILPAQSRAESGSSAYRLCEQTLFSAGRPVLLVPQILHAGTLGAHPAVAWNSSRSAARALNDALPLLERSEKATVIAVNPQEVLTANDARPLAELLEHLQRHGVSAQLLELSDVPAAAIARVLQEKAHAVGADLLVAGAHGHTWLREVLLGSVTRDLLADLTLPVMMSH